MQLEPSTVPGIHPPASLRATASVTKLEPGGTAQPAAAWGALPASTWATATAAPGSQPASVIRPHAPVLRLHDVGVGETRLNVACYPGEIVHLSGGSQAAQLRVLAMAAGFGPCGSGRCEVLGRDLHDLRDEERRALRERAVSRVLGCDHLTAAANVLAAVALPLVRQGCGLGDARARAELELESLGCGHLCGRRPDTLDAPESRQALLARALVTRPRLLVLEHPEQALSPVQVSSLRLALWSLSSAFGTCVLMTSQHARLLASADRFIDLDFSGGRPGWTAP
jgi:predicted ABC-type transport system involved in lysophospholipase L1 biosynthesis ATPase subunit